MRPFVLVFRFLAAVATAASLTGCASVEPLTAPAASSALHFSATGTVHGGQQPVSGASIQLYGVNATTDRGASSPLLILPQNSLADGSFSITTDYTCPSSSTLVYIVATGGNPGLGNNGSNATIGMAAPLGTCGALLGSPASNVVINELTTVAMVEAAASYMADLSHIGAADQIALGNAFAAAQAVVSSSTGNYAPPAAGTTQPVQLYNTLTDIVAACINTSGGSPTCASLFANTGNSADVIGALLYIVRNPGANVAALFNLIAGSGVPFQPVLASAPADFTTSLVIQVPATVVGNTTYNARLVAIDGQQHIWVANYNSTAMHVYDQTGALLLSPNACCATLFMTADSSGNIWSYGAGGSFTRFTPSGVATTIPIAAQYLNSVAGMAADNNGGIWLVDTPRSISGACVARFDSTGAPAAGFTNGPVCSQVTPQGPSGAIGTDSAGSAYFTFTNPKWLFAVTGAGTASPDTSFGGKSIPVSANPSVLHYDPSSAGYWILAGNSFVQVSKTVATTAGPVSDANGIQAPAAFALDGAGKLWFPNTVAPYGVGELSASGGLLSPSSASTPGFQPAGLNHPQGIAVDGGGNVWVVNYGNSTLVKMPGVATPKSQQVY